MHQIDSDFRGVEAEFELGAGVFVFFVAECIFQIEGETEIEDLPAYIEAEAVVCLRCKLNALPQRFGAAYGVALGVVVVDRHEREIVQVGRYIQRVEIAEEGYDIGQGANKTCVAALIGMCFGRTDGFRR